MEARATLSLGAAIASAMLLTACDGALFEPRERELSPCWPSCGEDAPRHDAGEEAHAAEPETDPEIRTDPERDPGAPDAGVSEDAGDRPLLALSGAFSTPHAVTFTWSPEEIDLDVQGYSLRIATSFEALESGQSEVWTSEEDPNLAFAVSPYGPGVVRQTTITGLTPLTAYAAELWAATAADDGVRVARGEGETIALPEGATTLFAEELHAEARRTGFMPPELAEQSHSGTRALWFEAETAHHEAHVSDIHIALPELPPDRFDRAYVELYVAVDGPAETSPAVPFIEVSLTGGTGTTFVHTYTALPGRPGWHRVELRLAAFLADTVLRLTQERSGGAITGFGVSASWPELSTVFIDDIVIRY